ncbi:MAG: AbrB/MazE/SpoVT family DNA-binding domain-containing protein [Anaerolineaceae bacterium]|nr:AbrB/MazE/SpoVT family DNA-binding domain-containing protein [Anaerolineaceae bacterium]
METRVKVWGNSLALRIPKRMAEEVGLYEDSQVELRLEEGKLIIVPVSEPEYELDLLLAQVTPENRHGEVATGQAAGGEAW